MATFAGLLSHSTVMSHCKGIPMLFFQYTMRTGVNGTHLIPFKGVSTRVPTPSAISRGGNSSGVTSYDDYHDDPFWLVLFKDTVRALNSLVAFLVEQHGQLKYIEWPSFKDTLRTATLTLVLVTMLIVALSSVDAALSFLLALLLRRPA